MSEISPSSSADPLSDGALGDAPSAVASTCWKAGVRYPGGAEIWCAFRNGEVAWTTDPLLAATYPSESAAVMAARILAEGDAQPFWQEVPK